MEGVKKAFGVMLLATALWLVTPVIPSSWRRCSAGPLLLVFSAIYLHASTRCRHTPRLAALLEGRGRVVLLLAGAAMLMGALAGSRDPLQPLGFLRAGGNAGPGARAEVRARRFG
jgi:thiol:disulfide interchange protein DsbD